VDITAWATSCWTQIGFVNKTCCCARDSAKFY